MPPKREPSREEIWDRFIDELDRCGQAGSAADVLTPSGLSPDLRGGALFGALTRDDVETLTRIGFALGRRGDVVKSIWEHTRNQRRKAKRDGEP